jgi:hypothetical protein
LNRPGSCPVLVRSFYTCSSIYISSHDQQVCHVLLKEQLCLQLFESTLSVRAPFFYSVLTMKSEYDRGRCKDVLRGLLSSCLASLSFTFTCPSLELEDGSTFEVEDFVVTSCSSQHRLTARLVGQKLDDAMMQAYAERESTPGPFVAQFLQGVGSMLQNGLDDFDWPIEPSHCHAPQGARRRICRHWRQTMGSLPMDKVRNQTRAGKFLKVLGLPGAHRVWVDSAYMRRYVLSHRSQHRAASSFALAADKSRGSGRDWLCSSIAGFETGLIGWMQPVVRPFQKQ